MDLNDFNLTADAENGAELMLEHPVTGAELDITIHLAGTDSAAYRSKQKEIQSKRISKMIRGKRPDMITSDDDACDLLAACTLGWSGMKEGGNDVPFSISEAKRIYLKHAWIREQVDLFIGDRANFTRQQ